MVIGYTMEELEPKGQIMNNNSTWHMAYNTVNFVLESQLSMLKSTDQEVNDGITA